MKKMTIGDFVKNRIDSFVEQNHRKVKGTTTYRGTTVPVVVEMGYDPEKQSQPWYVKADVILPGKPKQLIPTTVHYSSQEEFNEETEKYLQEIEVFE